MEAVFILLVLLSQISTNVLAWNNTHSLHSSSRGQKTNTISLGQDHGASRAVLRGAPIYPPPAFQGLGVPDPSSSFTASNVE